MTVHVLAVYTRLTWRAEHGNDPLPVLCAGQNCSIKSLAELHDNKGQKCCIIGTLFKKMDLKPNILKEISAKVSLTQSNYLLCETN